MATSGCNTFTPHSTKSSNPQRVTSPSPAAMGTGEAAQSSAYPRKSSCERGSSSQPISNCCNNRARSKRSLNVEGLPGVHHKIARMSGGVARGFDVGQILAQVLPKWPPAKLHRGEAKVDRLPRQPGCLVWRGTEQVTCIRPDAVSAAISQQFINRLARRLSPQIPERQVGAADGVNHSPAPAITIRLMIQVLPESFDVQRIPAPQQIGEPVPPLSRTGASKIALQT